MATTWGDIRVFVGGKEITGVESVTVSGCKYESIMCSLMAVSGLQKQEIVDFVSTNVVSYEDTYQFYCFAGRFPNVSECKAISLLGIHNMILLKQRVIL